MTTVIAHDGFGISSHQALAGLLSRSVPNPQPGQKRPTKGQATKRGRPAIFVNPRVLAKWV